MATLVVSDETATGRELARWSLDGLPNVLSVREIIRTRVREEVARHNLDRSNDATVLVAPTALEEAVNGSSSRRMVDWQRQADVAIRAFDANGFFVLVDDRQMSSLDQLVDLTRSPRVTFVRLVQLMGG